MKIKKINNEFILETEMIPILIKECSRIFGAKYYIQEFQTGNGIPDIVFAKNAKYKYYRKMDYESYYFLCELLKSDKIKFDKNIIRFEKYRQLKNYLINNGYIKQYSNNKFLKQKDILPLVDEIIAIEAKLSDWKNGFYQALRYKYFAQESYLAISASKVKNVDINLLKKYGIGLISVCNNEVKIVLNAKKEKPINYASCLYSSQNFYEKIYEQKNDFYKSKIQ